jgi:hypothetical protein
MRRQLALEAFFHFLVGLSVSFIIWAGLNEIAHDMFGAPGFPAWSIVVGAVAWTIHNTDWDEPAKRRAQEADDLRRRESIGKRLGMPPGVSRLIFKADADLLNVDHSLGAPTQMECCTIDYRKGSPDVCWNRRRWELATQSRGSLKQSCSPFDFAKCARSSTCRF